MAMKRAPLLLLLLAGCTRTPAFIPWTTEPAAFDDTASCAHQSKPAGWWCPRVSGGIEWRPEGR